MDLYKSVITDVMEFGRLKAREQSKDYGKYISRNEMNELKKVDLEKDDLDLKIRAFWFPPFDGAFIEVHGKRYTLVNDEILNSLAKYGTDGGIT